MERSISRTAGAGPAFAARLALVRRLRNAAVGAVSTGSPSLTLSAESGRFSAHPLRGALYPRSILSSQPPRTRASCRRSPTAVPELSLLLFRAVLSVLGGGPRYWGPSVSIRRVLCIFGLFARSIPTCLRLCLRCGAGLGAPDMSLRMSPGQVNPGSPKTTGGGAGPAFPLLWASLGELQAERGPTSRRPIHQGK